MKQLKNIKQWNSSYKKSLALLALAGLCASLPPPMSGTRAAYAQSVVINGQTLRSNVAPIQRNGRTLVAMRPIFEGLGATVIWNAATKVITAKTDASTIMMKIGTTGAIVDGHAAVLDQVPILYRGSTMVPLRFVSEALGAQVNYDARSRRIVISTNGKSASESAATASVSLQLDKQVYVPSEPINVTFTAPAGMSNGAWVGIVPSDIPSGNEKINNANRGAVRYLSGKTQGTLDFKAPSKLGSYDLRANDTKGNEVGLVSFEVKPTTPEITPTMNIAKTTYQPNEAIALDFTAFDFYANSSWIGIVPADIPHGDAKINNANRGSIRYLSGKTQGTFDFEAPRKPGRYDFRMNDIYGNELAATAAFTVEEG